MLVPDDAWRQCLPVVILSSRDYFDFLCGVLLITSYTLHLGTYFVRAFYLITFVVCTLGVFFSVRCLRSPLFMYWQMYSQKAPSQMPKKKKVHPINLMYYYWNIKIGGRMKGEIIYTLYQRIYIVYIYTM